MKILMVSWEYPPVVIGGLGRHVHHLATELVAAGHDVVVLSRRPSGTDPSTHPSTDEIAVTAVPDLAPTLTPRQKDVLALVVKGNSNKEIARGLGLGEGTVKVHLASLFRTLGVRSRSAAAAKGAMIASKNTGVSH